MFLITFANIQIISQCAIGCIKKSPPFQAGTIWIVAELTPQEVEQLADGRHGCGYHKELPCEGNPKGLLGGEDKGSDCPDDDDKEGEERTDFLECFHTTLLF